MNLPTLGSVLNKIYFPGDTLTTKWKFYTGLSIFKNITKSERKTNFRYEELNNLIKKGCLKDVFIEGTHYRTSTIISDGEGNEGKILMLPNGETFLKSSENRIAMLNAIIEYFSQLSLELVTEKGIPFEQKNEMVEKILAAIEAERRAFDVKES